MGESRSLQKIISKFGLTPQQVRFCQIYSNSMNGTQAAIAAGFSEVSARTIASRLLSKDNIQAYLIDLAARTEEKTIVTKARVLEELAALGFSDMKDFIEFRKGKKPRVKSFEETGEAKTRAIKKIKIRERRIEVDDEKADEFVGNTGDEPIRGGKSITLESHVEFELHDKIRPLDMMARHLKMYETDDDAGDTPDVDPVLDALGVSAKEDWAQDED